MRWGVLFAGVGGVEFGLSAAGQHPIWAVEMDVTAAKYHRLNHPRAQLIEADVQDVDVAELSNIDALWASPPCQSHSAARRKELPTRDDAWVGRDILRYTAALEPRVVLIENVPPYRKHPVYKEIVAGLVNQGYTVEARMLNAADYGVPQTRERLIIQARLDGRIAWPQSTKRVGWYQAIVDILPPPDRPLAPWQAKRWRAAYASLKPVLVDSKFAWARNAETESNLLTVRKDVEPGMTITAHTDRVDIVYPLMVDGQLKYGEDAQSVLTGDRPAPCVMASSHCPKDVVYPTPQPMRARLTAHCAARLQTLPDSAIWPDTFTAAIKLIGNAVPSLLAQRLAEAAAAPDVWRVSLWEAVSA